MLKSLTAGSGPLLRLTLRRDRLRLPLWVLGLSLFMTALVPVFQHLLIAGDNNQVFALMMENPAMVALVGPVYGAAHFHTGAAYANMMLVFCLIFTALMNIFLLTRHTRQDEEEGRLELIRSLPVGRLAGLSAALLEALLANVLLALLTGLGLYALRGAGMDLAGCLLFGGILGATGLVFAGLTAICCQLTANNRTATGMALGLLMLLYLLRAAGDIVAEALSLLSPLGLMLRTRVFVDNAFWPLALLVAEAALLAALALYLASRRDLGQGLIPPRPGKAHAGPGLASPLGLAFRLSRVTFLVWAYALFILAGTYASVFGEMEGFIQNNAMLSAIFRAMPEVSVTEQFITLLTAVMMMLAAIPVLGTMARLVSEERQGRTEHLLARSVTKSGQLGAWLMVGLLMCLVYPAVIALGFYGVGSLVYPQTPSLVTFLVSGYSYVPALLVLLWVLDLLAAALPRRVALGYALLGYSFFAIYFGRLMDLPPWVQKLSPLGHVPSYPTEPLTAAPLVVLTALAAALVLLAFLLYRKRDLATQ